MYDEVDLDEDALPMAPPDICGCCGDPLPLDCESPFCEECEENLDKLDAH
ncbi:hypothetical protein KEU06_09535 [Pseudaminobacter sp. 19-2017]|uniref:Uncharacterized protein n=1 Tax=Pseudaminobacter soli (ex Zhang et al. 2022) TaxID=2831468 RepID=A0A942DXJ4_9HYPH|nr:hypothetical protein [Pseudaminobacter soli]MBS3648847.1 hypothetical protein [Pseudaminobacter soli]